MEIFECSKCDSTYIFKDEEGTHISFSDAKKGFLVSRTLKTQKDVSAPPATTDGFDKKTLMILKSYGESQRPHMAVEHLQTLFAELKPVEIGHRLDLLLAKHLLENSGFHMPDSKNTCYRLSARGREYVIKNGLI